MYDKTDKILMFAFIIALGLILIMYYMNCDFLIICDIIGIIPLIIGLLLIILTLAWGYYINYYEEEIYILELIGFVIPYIIGFLPVFIALSIGGYLYIMYR